MKLLFVLFTLLRKGFSGLLCFTKGSLNTTCFIAKCIVVLKSKLTKGVWLHK